MTDGMPGALDDAFENRFRGSLPEVTRRLSIYLPVLAKASPPSSDAVVLDLGCGRCEWLVLLKESGYSVRGVDLSEASALKGQRAGFEVAQSDAVDYLRAQPAASAAAVTAFHVVEHLPAGHLADLLAESLRVLRPGGLLIVETPNPENHRVGACSFYIDPTHRAPIPPVLLEFLTEQAGFTGTWLARVNEDTLGSPLEMVPSGMPGAPQVNRSIDLVNAALFAPPDYAVIAQKGGGASTIEDSEELVRLCGTEPGGRTGLRPSEAESRLRAAEAAAQDAESRLQAAEAAAQDAEARVLALQVDLETLAQAAETRVAALEGEVQRALAGARRWKANAMEAEGAIDRLEEQAHAAEAKALRSAQESRDAWARLARVSRSSSWRATAPLRGLMKIVSRGGSSAGGSDEKSPTSDAPAGETIPSAVVDPGLMDLPESEREVLTDLEQALDHHSE